MYDKTSASEKVIIDEIKVTAVKNYSVLTLCLLSYYNIFGLRSRSIHNRFLCESLVILFCKR